MMRRFLFLLLTGLLIAGEAPTRAAQKQPTPPKTPGKAALADENAKEILLLMDTDKNGKISRDEWMKFMAAEFDRLDTDKSGELDPKELTKARLSFHAFHFADQGK
jgi:Ca2+-binding EF-hand superfamily protein